jgi:hypothetical protein
MDKIKTYTQLPIPLDSAWERKTWRRYAPIWFKQFIDGVSNLFKWLPIIWKDRHWDDHYIFEILKHKLILQREHLVSENRHIGVSTINRDITICLNLIERIQEDYYALEVYDYHKTEFRFTPAKDAPGCSELHVDTLSEDFDAYFGLHKATVKKCLKKDRTLSTSKEKLAQAVAEYKQEQCSRLLFSILNERIFWWWD